MREEDPSNIMNGRADTEDKDQWAFTFGSGQEHEGCFVVFSGSAETSREKMHAAFGPKWSLQYHYDEKFLEIVKRWNWKELRNVNQR